MNTFSIEGRPHFAHVAEFDGAAPFAEFYLEGGGAQTNIFQCCMELVYLNLLIKMKKFSFNFKRTFISP